VIVIPYVFKGSEELAAPPSCENTRLRRREHWRAALVLYGVNGKRQYHNEL